MSMPANKEAPNNSRLSSDIDIEFPRMLFTGGLLRHRLEELEGSSLNPGKSVLENHFTLHSSNGIHNFTPSLNEATDAGHYKPNIQLLRRDKCAVFIELFEIFSALAPCVFSVSDPRELKRVNRTRQQTSHTTASSTSCAHKQPTLDSPHATRRQGRKT